MKRIIEEVEKELERHMFINTDDGNVRNMNIEINNRMKAKIKNGVGLGFLDNGSIYYG